MNSWRILNKESTAGNIEPEKRIVVGRRYFSRNMLFMNTDPVLRDQRAGCRSTSNVSTSSLTISVSITNFLTSLLTSSFFFAIDLRIQF